MNIIKGLERKFKWAEIGQKDMTGKEICEGHIVAVRYAWNSYCGPIYYNRSSFRLFVTTSLEGHDINPDATYQIIGHWDSDHPDFSKSVKNWFHGGMKKSSPVKITVYDNVKTNPA